MVRKSLGAVAVALLASVGCKGEVATNGGEQPPSATAAARVSVPPSTRKGVRLVQEVQRRFRERPNKKGVARPILASAPLDDVFLEGDRLAPVPTAQRFHLATTTVQLPQLSTDAMIVSSGGIEASIKPQGFQKSAVEWGMRVAVYPDVAKGTHAFRRVTEDGVEDLYEVSEPTQKLSFAYDVSMKSVAGLRLVDDTLELLDAGGAPRLRATAPIVIDSNGDRRVGKLEVKGCAFDTDVRGPWGRAVVAPGAASCTVVASIDGGGLAYPVLVDPAWVGTGKNKQTHAYHTLLKLPAGPDANKILLVGGSGTAPTSTELYDVATGTWATSSALPEANGLAEGSRAIVFSDGTAVLAGGFPATGTITAKGTVLHRTAAGVWSYGDAMTSRAWFSFAVVTIGGKEMGLAAGGMASTTLSAKPLKSAEIYDPTTKAWASVGAMGSERSHAGFAVLSTGKLLVVGGHTYTTSKSTLSTTDLFDPATSTWSSAGTLTTPRADSVVVALPGGAALVTGGWNTSSDTLGTLEHFDGTTFSAMAAKMTQPRMFHTATRLNDGRVLLAGGNVEIDDPLFVMTPTASADLFLPGSDAKTGTIASTSTMSTDRIYAAAISLGDKVLMTGGLTTEFDGSENSIAEIYDGTIGAKCGAGVACAAGLFCTEGVCCNKASCPEGQTCAAPGYEGACVKPKGATCTSNTECATGYCVTGVCCETACSGQCKACNAKGSEGKCVMAAAGTDPGGFCGAGSDPFCGPKCDAFGDCDFGAPLGTKCGASAIGDGGTGSFCKSYACDDWGDCLETTSDCGLTCTTKVTCDEATKTCTPLATGIKAGFCVIDNACFSYGDLNPKNPCLLCDPPTSKTAWSPSTSCVDGGLPDSGPEVGADTGSDAGKADTGGSDAGKADTGGSDAGSVEDTSVEPPDTSTGPVDTGTPVDASLPEAKACSCEVPGRTSANDNGAMLAIAGLAIAVGVARRRR